MIARRIFRLAVERSEYLVVEARVRRHSLDQVGRVAEDGGDLLEVDPVEVDVRARFAVVDVDGRLVSDSTSKADGGQVPTVLTGGEQLGEVVGLIGVESWSGADGEDNGGQHRVEAYAGTRVDG